MIKAFKRFVPEPIRVGVRLRIRAIKRISKRIYNQRKIWLFPYSKTLITRVFGEELHCPIRDNFYENFFGKNCPSFTWKSTFFDFLKNDRRGVFLDIGANIGQTLVEFNARKAPQSYVGFEPNPSCAGFCNELIFANGFDATVHPCALSASVGSIDLLIDPEHAGDSGASMISDLRPDRTYRKLSIVHLPLSHFRKSIDYSEVALVKIDVEGAELLVLQGAEDLLSEGDPMIICEVLRADGQADLEQIDARNRTLKTLLEKHGYQVYEIQKKSEHDRSFTIRKIEKFPSEYWTQSKSHMNDYLFARPHHIDDLRTRTTVDIAVEID